jgi:hypothetical protein
MIRLDTTSADAACHGKRKRTGSSCRERVLDTSNSGNRPSKQILGSKTDRYRSGVDVAQQLDGAAQAGLVADLPGDRTGVQVDPVLSSPTWPGMSHS